MLTLSLKTAEQIHKRNECGYHAVHKSPITKKLNPIKIIENIKNDLKIKFGQSRQEEKKLIELLKVEYKINGEIILSK